MNWFKRKFDMKDEGRGKKDETENRPSSLIRRPSFNILFRAAKVCAVALVFVSGSLWLAWAMILLVLMVTGAMIGSEMFVLAGDADYASGKVDNDSGFFEKIKPQEAFDRTLRGKIMADDLHILDLNSEGPEFGDGDKRDVFNAASRGYFNSTPCPHRIASYGDGGFRRDHGVCGPGIHGHFQRKLNSLVCYFRVAEDNGLPGVEFKLGHRSKSGRVAFGERIFRVFYQQFFNLERFEQDLVDVLPVVAVGDNFSRNRSRRCFIEFVDGNQEPFAVKSFFHFFDFHISHLGIKGIIAGQGCQGGFRNMLSLDNFLTFS